MKRFREILRATTADHLPSLGVLAAVHLLLYHEHWLGTIIFTSKDYLENAIPLVIFQADCIKDMTYPLWNPYMNFGFPYVGHFTNTIFFPTHFLIGLLTSASLEVVQRELLLWIFFGGVGTYLAVLELGSSRRAAVVAAVSFMFCGQLIMLPHFYYLIYNACSFPFWIYGYHRAKRKKDALSITTIFFVCMMIFGGYMPATIMGIYLFSFYVVLDSVRSGELLFGVRLLATTFVLAVLVALPKLVPVYLSLEMSPRTNIAYANMLDSMKDTRNIVNAYNFLSYLLPVKFFFSLYIGSLSTVAFVHSALNRKIRVNALLVLAVISAWLFMVSTDGNVSLLRSASYVLPFMKHIRNEWFYWFYPSLFAILYLAPAVDGFLDDVDRKKQFASVSLVAGATTVALVLAYNVRLHYLAYLTHIIIIFGWFCVVLAPERRQVRTIALYLLLAADVFLVFSRVSIDSPPLREGSLVKVVAHDQWGPPLSYQDDIRVSTHYPIVFTDTRFRPTIEESRQLPVLFLGRDEHFLDSMTQKRFAGWWYNSQPNREYLDLIKTPQFEALDQRPLFGFFDPSGTHLPEAASFDDISCSSFSFTVRTPVPGVFLLHQMFDARWKALIDGAEQEVFRADRYFMAVSVSPGEHTLWFVFPHRPFWASLVVSGCSLLGILIMRLSRSRRKLAGPTVRGVPDREQETGIFSR